MAQIFVTDFGDVQVFPMHSKKDAHQSLLRYFQEIGVPTSMHAGSAKELSTKKVWSNIMEKHRYIKQSYIEPGSPWQNAAECKIGVIKKSILKEMTRTNSPRRLWGVLVEHVAQLRYHTSRDNYPMLQGRPQREFIVQDTLDIS